MKATRTQIEMTEKAMRDREARERFHSQRQKRRVPVAITPRGKVIFQTSATPSK